MRAGPGHVSRVVDRSPILGFSRVPFLNGESWVRCCSLPSHLTLSPPVGPILLAKPEPMSVDVGEDAFFSCAWRGNPLPRVTWTRRGGVQVRPCLGLVWWQAVDGASSQGPVPDAPSYPRCWALGPRSVFGRWDPRIQVTTCAGLSRGSRA